MPAIDNISAPQRRAAAWWLGLFGLPFMAIAFWLLFAGVWPALSDWARMSRWQPAQATLLAAELAVRPGSRGGASSEATATYRYTVGGEEYTSQRVGISRGSDNLGSYQADMARTLLGHLQRGEPLRIWVNPANPLDATIDRGLRRELLCLHAGLALVFGAIGLGLLFFALRLHRAPRPGPGPRAKAKAGGKTGERAPGLPQQYGNIWLHQVPGGVRVHLPYGRDLGRHIGALAGGFAFLAVAIGVWWFMERGDTVAGIFAAVFGLVGVAFSASSLFCITTSLQAELDGRGIRVHRRFLGLPLHSHQVPAGMVKRLALTYEQTTDHGGREIAWYRLQAQLKSGATIALTDSLEGEDAARGLFEQVVALSGYRR